VEQLIESAESHEASLWEELSAQVDRAVENASKLKGFRNMSILGSLL
jgi:hypothetical protein